MGLFRWFVTLGLALLLAAPLLQAQQNQPHIGYVYPAGGQKGTKFQILIGGQFLDETTQVLVTGGGFTATVVEQTKPLAGKELQLLRDKIKTLQEKKQAAALGPTKSEGKDGAKVTPPPVFTAEETGRTGGRLSEIM